MSSRRLMLRCSMRMKSAMISRAERKAVSPLVIGAATTPSMASMPPATPSQSLQMIFTTLGADVENPLLANSVMT